MALRVQQAQWHPHVRQAAQGIGYCRTALLAEVIAVAAGLLPTVDVGLPGQPVKVGGSDDGRTVVTGAGLSAAQGAVASVEKQRRGLKGKSDAGAKALSGGHVHIPGGFPPIILRQGRRGWRTE